MTSKTELKRLCVQYPIGMAERMHRLEKERDELRVALIVARDELVDLNKRIGWRDGEWHSVQVANTALEKDPA